MSFHRFIIGLDGGPRSITAARTGLAAQASRAAASIVTADEPPVEVE